MCFQYWKLVNVLSLAKVRSWITDFDQCEITEGYLGKTKPSEGFSTRTGYQNSSQERYRRCGVGMCGCERGFSQRWVGIGGVAGGVESKGGSQGVTVGVLDVLQRVVLTKRVSRGLRIMTRDSSDTNGGCILNV